MQAHPNEKKQHNFTEQSQTLSTVDMLCLHESPFVRGLYITAGFIALLMGILGIILPVLPTTPFILLAAYCFARSSARFHERLLTNRIAGPVIREWCQHRSIPRRAKRWAYLLIAVSFCISILWVPDTWQKIMLAVIGIILTFFISRIPVRDTKITEIK